VLEAERLGWAATGRNGGFCAASLTHGVGNGLARWPGEMPLLQRLGPANLDAIEATIRERGIDCDFERTGELDVAVEPWQLKDLGSLHRTMRDLGEDVELLTAAQTRALVSSPTYLGGGSWIDVGWRHRHVNPVQRLVAAGVRGQGRLGPGIHRSGRRRVTIRCTGLSGSVGRQDNERTRLEMVRRPPLPWPPEPLRWLWIQMTRRSIARADDHGGQRDIWLRLLDRLGLGFDS